MQKVFLSTLAILSIASPAIASNAFKAGDILIRARTLGVVTQESSTLSIGGTVNIDNSIVPELDISYFFTPNISAELIAAVSPHNVRTSAGVDAGEVWLLPPTLTLQYHITQFDSFKPYVGAGINYTYFFNGDGGALNSVKYSDSLGGVLQIGVDIPLGNNWYANADIKKVFISSTGKFSPSGVSAKVDIDPLLIGIGIGYKF